MPWSKEKMKEYQRKYWAENKERINAAKRTRYYTDPEYRAAEIERKKQCRRKAKKKDETVC